MDRQESDQRNVPRWTLIEAYRRPDPQETRPEPRSFTHWEPSALKHLEEDIENG